MLRRLLEARLRVHSGLKPISEWLTKGTAWELSPEADRLYSGLLASKHPMAELVTAMIDTMIPVAGNLTQQTALLVDLYLQPKYEEYKRRIIKLANRDDKEAFEELGGFVYEGVRIRPVVIGLPPRAMRDVVIKDGDREVHLKAGQRLIIGTSKAHLDPNAFPDPEKLNPHRPLKDCILLGKGMYFCFGARLLGFAMAGMLKEIFKLFNLRRAPGRQGSFVQVSGNVGDGIIKWPPDEQRKLYLEPALNNRIIGCYAQTELAHGSNVQGLETTDTWIEADKEFEIYSPSLTASKWWIGGLGRSADHAIFMAQLIVNGKRKGPHPFIIQIREVETREIFPGRLIGDIGPKAGYGGVDNGFMLFDHVRVPHVAMLAKLSRLEPDSGLYHPPVNAALNYGTLSFIRSQIVQQASKVHMRAVTVAVRYCAIRRQFADRDHPLYENGKPLETPVLDYTMVQVRLFPILARAFAFHYTAKYMFDLFHRNQANVQKGDLSLLADMHATSSGLKSLVSIASAQAVEDCRRACGGHGFSLAAGLPTQYANYLPTVTWEGDSYMLTQQVARALFKTMRALKSGGGPKEDTITTDYIKRYLRTPTQRASIAFTGDLLDPLFFTRAFGHRAAFLTERALELRDVQKRSWNELLVEMFQMSRAHSEYVVVRQFAFAILNDEDLNSRPAIRNVVQQLFLLFATHTMVEQGADFLASGFIDPAQFALLRTTMMKSMAELRPNAVALVDGFALPDYLLNSALGRSDGKVYESLFDFALREPLNATKWNGNIDDLDTLDIEKAERSKL